MDDWWDVAQYKSAAIQGRLRFENSTMYNLTVTSNMNYNLYINRELILTKENLQNQTQSKLDFYVQRAILYDVEVHMCSDSLYQ